MRNFLKLSLICLIAVSAISLNSCKKSNTKIPQELIGKWNAVKVVWDDGETYAEDLEFVFIQFNADKTCLFNIEGLRNDDVAANYSYENKVIKLSNPEDASEFIVCNVEKLTATELVLNFPPLEADETSFTIYYVKAQ